MNNSFIVTMTIDERPVIFRFEKSTTERYRVSIVNNRRAEPFELTKINSGWIVKGNIPPDIEYSKDKIIAHFKSLTLSEDTNR